MMTYLRFNLYRWIRIPAGPVAKNLRVAREASAETMNTPYLSKRLSRQGQNLRRTH